MKFFQHAVVAGGLVSMMSLAAVAQPWSGQVYGVYPEGILMSQGAQTVLVPHEHASFQLGGLRLDYSKISPGQTIMVNMPQQYAPNIQYIPNRTQWVNRYHPHGAPPGQAKKWDCDHDHDHHDHGHGHRDGKGRKGKHH